MSHSDAKAAAARLVARTCEAQGAPLHIEDPATLAKIARLMNGGGASLRKKSAGTTLTTTATPTKGGDRG